jgi:antitoxin component YwqK of YwqJK toxin-antitoxin module
MKSSGLIFLMWLGVVCFVTAGVAKAEELDQQKSAEKEQKIITDFEGLPKRGSTRSLLHYIKKHKLLPTKKEGRRRKLDIPEDFKARVTFGRYYDHGQTTSTNQFEPYVQSYVPLDQEGKPHGLELRFTERGGPVRTVTWVHGVKHGPERIGNKIEIPWVKGKVEGKKKTFYRNGQVSSIMPYVDGEPHGELISYDREGRLVRKGKMVKGERQGELIDYYPETGNPKRIVPYKDDKVDGTVRMFYRDGTLKTEMPFKQDVRHGVEKEYDGQGELERIIYWYDGERVSKAEYLARS